MNKFDTNINILNGEKKFLSLNLEDIYNLNIVLEENSSLNLNIISKNSVNINSKIFAKKNSHLKVNNFIYTNDYSKYNYDIFADNNSDVKINVKMHTKTQIDGDVNIISNNGSNTFINYLILGEGDSRYNLKQNIHHKGSNSVHFMSSSGVLKDNSFVSLIGDIFIDQNLKEVESKMRGKFITKDKSKVYSIPILRVWSQDVRTEHSISSISADNLQDDYIFSRGVDRDSLKSLFEENLIRENFNNW